MFRLRRTFVSSDNGGGAPVKPRAVLAVGQYNASNAAHIFATQDISLGTETVWKNVTPSSWAFLTRLTTPIQVLGCTINQTTRSVWVSLRGANGAYTVIRSTNALNSPDETAAWTEAPFRTTTTPPLTYSTNISRHPRVLFDDQLIASGVGIRMVRGDATGAIADDAEHYILMVNDDLDVLSITAIGDADAWTEAAMVEFNDDATGFLSYHTYYGGGWQYRRLNVPFGTAHADLLSYVGSVNRPSWMRSDPIVSTGVNGERIQGGDDNMMYAFNESNIEDAVDPRSKVTDFDNVEMAVDDSYSEQPFARNIKKRAGWLATCANRAGYQGLWFAEDGETFTKINTNTYLAVHPAIYPNKDPFIAMFERDYYAAPHTEGRVLLYYPESGTEVDSTGNLHSLVSGAQWSDYQFDRKPLDVCWAT